MTYLWQTTDNQLTCDVQIWKWLNCRPVIQKAWQMNWWDQAVVWTLTASVAWAASSYTKVVYRSPWKFCLNILSVKIVTGLLISQQETWILPLLHSNSQQHFQVLVEFQHCDGSNIKNIKKRVCCSISGSWSSSVIILYIDQHKQSVVSVLSEEAIRKRDKSQVWWWWRVSQKHISWYKLLIKAVWLLYRQFLTICDGREVDWNNKRRPWKQADKKVSLHGWKD